MRKHTSTDLLLRAFDDSCLVGVLEHSKVSTRLGDSLASNQNVV